MPTDLPPDYEPSTKKMLDAATYLSVLERLTRRTAGPVGLLWGLSTLVILAIIFFLAGGVGAWLTDGDPPDARLVAVALVLFLLADLFRKALYGPLRQLAKPENHTMSLSEVARLAAVRMLPVLGMQFVVGAIITAFAILCLAFGVFGFIPITILSFMLAPALYFSATGKDIAESLRRAVGVTRRHGPWVLGMPALFLCLGALVGSVTDISMIDVALLPLEAVMDGDAVGLLKVATMSLIYGWVRWLSIGAVYVAVDGSAETRER